MCGRSSLRIDRNFVFQPCRRKQLQQKLNLHRPELRELIKNKIKELEFKVALELFGAVARLVPKDEVRNNPKAKAALDKEWENLRTKGVWDESRVRECKSIVDEARKNGQTVHVGRISLRHAMKRAQSFPLMIHVENTRVVQSSKETMSGIRIQTMHCLLSLARHQLPWKQPNFWTLSDPSLASQRRKPTLFRRTFRPSLLVCQHGFLCRGIDGRNIGRKSFGNPWFLWY